MILIEKNSELFELHKKVMSEKIIIEIDKILKKPYKQLKEKRVNITSRIKKLLNHIKKNIDDYVIADSESQMELIKYFMIHYDELTTSYKPKSSKPNIYLLIRYLFENRGYNEFTKGFEYIDEVGKRKIYSAYLFVRLLSLKTCPYCNRNYITLIEKEQNGDKQRRPDLDHFHPKSIFPFLAVNFYNLIPSCSTCNKLKSDDISLKLIHPYDSKVNEMKITYWLNDMRFYHTKEITFDSTNSIDIKIKNMPNINKQVFQIERLYQEHKDIVIELILKHLHYPSSYIKELSDFGYSKEEIYRFVFSNYLEENEFSKRPLAKLTRDIAEELGLLDYIDNENITS